MSKNTGIAVAVQIKMRRLYAAVLSRMIPLIAEPTTPELSSSKPRIETSKGDCPNGKNCELITIPKLKYIPIKEEKPAVKIRRFLFVQISRSPTERSIF